MWQRRCAAPTSFLGGVQCSSHRRRESCGGRTEGERERTGGRGERLADARLLVVVSFNLKLCFRLDSL
jgi:hypothetical protein